MKTFLLLITAGAVLLAFAPAASAAARGGKIFPFDYSIDDLENGLRLITVPLPYPDLVAFYAVVRAGSRNEVEPGKSGFAHFFEHMMFRGTEKYPPRKYNAILTKMGASQNAFTTDDFTAYHTVFGKEDLEMIMKIEADRFQNLKYPEPAFRTEAKAVLGEYNKNSANPFNKLYEALRDASFQRHTYKHTTMGFLKDIQNMPNQFDYSRKFFDRFYRPENVVLIVAGDVRHEKVLGLVRKYWEGWRRGGFKQEIPAEGKPDGPHTVHVDWDTPTLPWVVVAYRGPAFSTRRPDMAALDVAGEIAFSESSPLYRELVLEEQKVDALFTFFGDRRDPGLLLIASRVKQAQDVAGVRRRILETIDDLRSRPVDTARLEAVKSNLKYAFGLSMDNTQSVAAALANYVELEPTPETINKTYALYDALTPDQIQKAAKRYFTPQLRTIGTLSGPGQRIEQAASGATPAIDEVLRPSDVPLVSFRLLFHTGAAADPKGKEGLAALTASMLSGGGSAAMSYDAIVQAFYPMAAGLSSQIDKEMTVFYGTTHRDNLDGYYDIISSMLLDPGWREDDFERLRDDAVNYLKVNLRGNNDEELGKEALYEFIYGPVHPYGHVNEGAVQALEAVTLDDIKKFYRDHYARANLTIGLAGGYPADFVHRLERDFARLPAVQAQRIAIPPAPPIVGQHLEIIEKDTRATAISLGFPIKVTRRHPDWAALWLVRSYLGQHRSSTSHLFQRIREVRGLNYGDYAYIEYFPRGMFQFQPDPNLGRQRQIFQIWVRPVEPANAHFALRIAMYELQKLVEEGLSAERFEQTRDFLEKYVALMATRQSVQLGYALDSEYYGTGEFVPWVRKQLAKLTREDVNRVIRENLDWRNVKIVIVAKDAQDLKERILSNTVSPIKYNAAKPAAVLEEDKVIERYRLDIKPSNAAIVPVAEVFN